MAETVEIRLNRIGQLFNSLDPSPFHERDLDRDAEEHIAGWARELPARARLAIRVHLPASEAGRPGAGDIAQAIGNYFAYRATMIDRDMRELFRLGWRYLAIGLAVLVVCLSASQFVEARLGDGALGALLRESLIILGWVANWKPLETFLYEWLPLRRRRDLYRRLAAADVKLEFRPASGADTAVD